MHRSCVGSAFVQRLSAEAFESRAVRHPYLQALKQGDFANVPMALQDFAFEYGLYSTRFIDYLAAVVDQLRSADHRAVLRCNLAEEQGAVHDVELPDDVLQSVAGLSHANLFQRFQEALGVQVNRASHTTASQDGAQWSQRFLALCKSSECTAIGAIGIGTELIVSEIYRQILEGLKAHSALTTSQRVFFDLHSHCDDEHAEHIIEITKELARDSETHDQIALGVRTALELRAAFWDKMLERAQSFPASTSPTGELPDIGYQEGLRRQRQ